MDPGGKLITDPPEIDPQHLTIVFFKPAPDSEVRLLRVHSVQQSPLHKIRETKKIYVLVFGVLQYAAACIRGVRIWSFWVDAKGDSAHTFKQKVEPGSFEIQIFLGILYIGSR